MKTVKTIIYWSYYAGVPDEKTVGVFESEKIHEAIEEIKNQMAKKNYRLISEHKDCCDYILKYEDDNVVGSDRNIVFLTKSHVINELNL